MHKNSMTRAARGLALLALLCSGSNVSFGLSQATHSYVAPNPQRYQQRPTTQRPDDYAEPVGGAVVADDTTTSQPAQPTVRNTAGMSSAQLTLNEAVDFVHEHMIATFLCMLMIAPLWAVFGMRKTSHPYDH